jgi:hypothetical protein
MAAEQDPAGAVSHKPEGWYEQDFRKAQKEVRRLQARIVQATQAGRWLHSQRFAVAKPRPSPGVSEA